MKVFAVLALFAAAFASICEDENSNSDNIDNVIAMIKIYVDNSFMSGCMPGGDTFTNFFFGNDNCRAIFDTGYCYFNVGKERYELVETVTWDLVAGGIGNAKEMGQVLCGNTEACYTPVKEAFLECMEDDEFSARVMSDARMYFDLARSAGAAYAGANRESIDGRIADMVLSRFTSFDDVMAAIEENQEDLQDAFTSVVDTAADFCESKCVEQTADYIVPFLEAIQDDVCHDVQVFCGQCKDNAVAHINDNGLPCCLTDVVDSAIAEIDRLKEEYSEQIDAVLGDEGEAPEGGPKKDPKREMAEMAYNEILCLRDMYEGRTSDCSEYEVA